MKIHEPNITPILTKDFLEDAPLFKWVNMRSKHVLHFFSKSPSIKLRCKTCGDIQTFKYSGIDEQEWMKHAERGWRNDYYSNKCLKINYLCMGCEKWPAHFLIKFDEAGTRMQKVGQFPSPKKEADRDLVAILGDKSLFLEKGLLCESHSFGIAAHAYYRRILELMIDDLIQEIISLIPAAEASAYADTIEKVRSSIVTEEKINLISNILPPALKPQGNNPMKSLYQALSIGIHALSDEDCLELAKTIRLNLESFVHLLNANLHSQKQLTETTDKIRGYLDKIGKKS